MSKIRTDAVSVAETLVRDCLETLMSRHEYVVSKTPAAPTKTEARIKDESEAVIALATRVLAHLDAEAKQLRVEQS